MTIMVWLVLFALAVKLIWNLGVPFVLIRRAKANPAPRTSAISMVPAVEVALLFIAIFLSTLSTGEAWINRPLAVAGWGITAILFTYAHLVVTGAVGGWLVARQNRNKTTREERK